MADSKTVETVKRLVKPVIEEMGFRLWDVRFLKEGASWYLRIFIDSEMGVDINDCTDVSHAIDPIIDEADPIDKAYYLEVCSPGLGREIRTEEHFNLMREKPVVIHTYRPIDGLRDIRGSLLEWTKESITLATEEGAFVIDRKDVSGIKADDLD